MSAYNAKHIDDDALCLHHLKLSGSPRQPNGVSRSQNALGLAGRVYSNLVLRI